MAKNLKVHTMAKKLKVHTMVWTAIIAMVMLRVAVSGSKVVVVSTRQHHLKQGDVVQETKPGDKAKETNAPSQTSSLMPVTLFDSFSSSGNPISSTIKSMPSSSPSTNSTKEEPASPFTATSSNQQQGRAGQDDSSCTDDYYPCDYYSSETIAVNDPGATLLIVTIACCFLSVAILPFLFRWGEQYDRHKSRSNQQQQQQQQQHNPTTTSFRRSLGLWQHYILRRKNNNNDDTASPDVSNNELVDYGYGDGGEKATELGTHFNLKSNSGEQFCNSSMNNNSSAADTLNQQQHHYSTKPNKLQGETYDESYCGCTDDDGTSVAHSIASVLSAKSIASFLEDVIASSPQSKRQLAMHPAPRMYTFQKHLNTERQHHKAENSNPEVELVIAGGSSSDASVRSMENHHSRILLTCDIPADRVLTLQQTLTNVNQFDAAGRSSTGSPPTIERTLKNLYASENDSDSTSIVDNVNHSDKIVVDEDIRDLRICCGPSAFWRPWVARQAFHEALRYCEVDKDAKRLVKLAIPFTAAEFLLGVSRNIHWVLISRKLGTAYLAAATVADIFQGITAAFLGGIISAQVSVTSHALGAGNHYLAGQYVQQAQILFTVCFVPTYILWWYTVYPLTLRLGMSEKVAIIASSYNKVEMINNWLAWLLYSVHGMYEVTDRPIFSAVTKIVTAYLYLTAVALALTYVEGATLVTIAYISMGINVLGILWAIFYPWYRGWLAIFIPGWLCNFALTNTKAMLNLVKAAVPLAFGDLIAYTEWEVLTIFVAHYGQTQVAAYALLGTLWETFESFTAGIGEAAVIRVAFHLGQGNPRAAQISGYRSAMIGSVVAYFVTSIFWIFGEEIPSWFSPDPEVQTAMLGSIPLMGVGNICLVTGMVCWSVLGGQGRYSLATTWSFVCSFLVTLPLAALFVFKLGYGVQGIIAATAIGYSTLGMVLVVIMCRSDWTKLSEIIQRKNAVEIADSTIHPMTPDTDARESASVSSASAPPPPPPRISFLLPAYTPSRAPSDEFLTDHIELQIG